MPTVLVTGAAGGIGALAVRRFLEAGWTVVATDRSAEGLAQISADEATRSRLHRVSMDVTLDASVAEAARAVTALTSGQGPDVLVNNAGLGLLSPVVEMQEAELRLMLEVNVLGLLRVTRAFIPALCERRGRVVNVGSLAGIVTLPFFGGYSASKYAVEAISDAMRMELAPFGVRVSLVEPAIVATGFVDACVRSLRAHAERGSRWRDALERSARLRSTLQRAELPPERVARAIVRAATARRPRARYPVGRVASWLIRALHSSPVSWRDGAMRWLVGLAS
ncbi:MAG: SDR family NAD(P)-dependent oxidoreductase [Deltaproteobacteria bacterium]|nr:SDR family NAD(P)-dependent oxidoreductase [Deltaproteobacteria bacterium]